MFQKPAFGSNTSGFGSFNAGASTSSPFGSFKPTTGTSAFGAPPAFGTATAQPTTGGGLFGSTNTTSGLFGGSTASTSAPSFGSTGFGGFGSSTPTTGVLFGGNNTSTGLFGANQNTNAFGGKIAGFGYDNAAPAGSTLFGSTPTASTGLFGQQNNNMSGGGIFNNTAGAFGQVGQQPAATGTAHVKYNPVLGTEMVVKSGTSQNINIRHHCITFMKDFEGKSLEELRMEDYAAGRKGSAGGMFGGFQQPAVNKPLFGGNTFGQPATTTAPSVFGGGGLGTNTGFGQSNAFSFGNNNQATTSTTNLFGATKPAFGSTTTTGGLFGTTTTQAPSFGATPTSTFGFGTNTQNQSAGLFGPPIASAPFGNGTIGGFGSFSSGGLFGAKPATTVASLTSTAPTFGSTGGAFGAGTFGKPAAAPAFGFNTQPLGLGAGLGSNTFQAKPAGTGFGTLGGGVFTPQMSTLSTPAFKPDGGTGLFGNTSTLGGTLPGLGGFNTTNNTLANNSLSGASAAGNVHEQILTLAARPYGDSPLFKDLLPDSSTTAEDVLKPTNPAAVKAVLNSYNNAYRVTSPPSNMLKLQPRPIALSTDKKSLFDGLEESDASLEDKLSLKPSRKRLLLRPHNKINENNNDSENRRQEDTSRVEVDGVQSNKQNSSVVIEGSRTENDQDKRSNADYTQNNTNVDTGSDRHSSWLNSTNLPWNDKENQLGIEPTPRLYPNLDKEINNQTSERRASWLTTKQLRKPPPANPEAVENSVRELGVRSERIEDKENIDNISVSEEENVPPRETAAHPTGIKLTRPGYYTIPSLDDMINYMRPDGSCVVPHLTVGRKKYGNVYYDCEIDVAGMDLDTLVHFLNKEVIIYPEDLDKPPIGEGLNRRAIVTLDGIWPRDKTERRLITDPERLLKMDYEGKLRRVCDKHDTKFIEYRPQTGSWVFRVEHFSKYGLTDSDEEDDLTPDVMKRQIAHQALQKAAALAPPKPPAVVPPAGLGGFSSIGTDAIPASTQRDPFVMQNSSLNIVNGTPKAFEMDTTEDNTESQSMYQDTSKAFGVTSPTSELARLENRRSHNVQLMKASLYTETDMEDDMSTSTGDQLVPQPTCLLSIPPTEIRYRPEIEEPIPMDQVTQDIITEEPQMRPLILQPETIVMKYHRKVPPFKHTIAGKLDAACISDMSICRARHARVGFGPSGAVAMATTLQRISNLTKSADLYQLGNYVAGRGEDDWSETVVSVLALGQADNGGYVQEVLTRQLSTILKYTEEPASDTTCERARVKHSPRDRLELLRDLIADAEHGKGRQFGVSSAYCLEVLRLCEALWGLDLDNDGVPGTDDQSTVSRHTALLDWMCGAVAMVTDAELARPSSGEEEDEGDKHSATVWNLLLGGRVLEACKLAKENGDLNMAMLIAQASSDSIFRSLISRQLSLWRQCGADKLISGHRLATLHLLAGLTSPREKLMEADWLRALHATSRYLCPQVPSLEQIIRTYESFFSKDQDDEELIDLTVVDDVTMMKYPLPPYLKDYDVSMINNNQKRRILDLRYELMRARAFNSRPKLQPAMYTPDPMDFSLCFILGIWFGSPSVESVVGFAEQLEAAGLWHLAIQVLTHHPHDNARHHMVQSVQSRHVSSRPCARSGSLRTFGVPPKWTLLAHAHRAKYEKKPALEAQYLVAAEQWNAAHKVLLDELLPEAVLTDNLQSISDILEKLHQAAERHEVSGWESGGQALYHYIHVCEEIRSLVAEGSRRDVGARLQALRPRVAAVCRGLAAQRDSRTNPRALAARSEMGGRLGALCGASGGHLLLPALAPLKLPPHCHKHLVRKMTKELADQASELCIESPRSSPRSSQHRALTAS